MKTVASKISILITIVLFTACKHSNPEMFTNINPDGSCYREISIFSDSAFLAGDTTKNPFPVKLDSTWVLVFATKNGPKSQIETYSKGKIYTIDTSLNKRIIVRKKFQLVKDLETFRFNNSDWDTLATSINFHKKFKWFYTYYEFSETYPKINPFKLVPINNYLTNEEITTLYGENTSLYKGKNGLEIKDLLNSIEEKGNAWLSRSYYEEFCQIILKHYKAFKDLPVDSATFAHAKDSIYLLNKDSMDIDKLEFEVLFDKYFKTKAFSKNKMPKEIDKVIKEEIPDITKYFTETIKYNLAMPGKIIKTNSTIINNDTLTWVLDANRFFFTDYSLQAKSRQPNTWAFAISAFMVILVAVSFWIKRK